MDQIVYELQPLMEFVSYIHFINNIIYKAYAIPKDWEKHINKEVTSLSLVSNREIILWSYHD